MDRVSSRNYTPHSPKKLEVRILIWTGCSLFSCFSWHKEVVSGSRLVFGGEKDPERHSGCFRQRHVRLKDRNMPHMGVSKNSGTNKLSILIRFSLINHPFRGTTIFGNTHIYAWILMWILLRFHPDCMEVKRFFAPSPQDPHDHNISVDHLK